jgi:hypothetical protein
MYGFKFSIGDKVSIKYTIFASGLITNKFKTLEGRVYYEVFRLYRYKVYPESRLRKI